ncbi:hypothetical protein [Rheinheimera gaetbuli]
MSEPIPLPNVSFNVGDRGGDYFTKLQLLAAAVNSSIAAYNAAVAAGTDASGYVQQIELIQAEINTAMVTAMLDIAAIRADTLAIAEAAFSDALALPVIVAADGSYTIADHTPAVEIVCLGSATITFPTAPFAAAKYVVKSTGKNAVVNGVLGAGHQITDSDGVLHDSFTIEGLYQLDVHWLGAGLYRGF